MYNDGGMVFGSGVMWIFWILVIIVIIFGVKMIASGNEKDENHAEDSPLRNIKETLRARRN